jgi:hypothetical protein
MSYSKIVEAAVQNILENPLNYEWTVQGLGMLRTNLSPHVRLHIWDSELRVPNVTLHHTHPWSFDSVIVRGSMINIRYAIVAPGVEGATEYVHRGVACGPGGGLQGKYQILWLLPLAEERYTDGTCYTQSASDIHSSHATDGTVSIITKDVASGGNKAASVFWKNDGREWVSAEPRPAKEHEMWRAVKKALQFHGLRGATYATCSTGSVRAIP